MTSYRNQIIKLINQHRKESPYCPKVGCFCVDVELFEIAFPLIIEKEKIEKSRRKSCRSKKSYKIFCGG